MTGPSEKRTSGRKLVTVCLRNLGLRLTSIRGWDDESPRTLTRLVIGAVLIAFVIPTQAWPQLPPPEAYVQVRDGHLSRNGQRVRLWGMNIHGPDLTGRSSHSKVHASVERLQAMGFNAVRLWGGRALVEVKDEKRIQHTYRKGDGSALDLMDYAIARLKEKGFIIWLTWFGYHALTPEDAGIVTEAATRTRWMQAVRELQEPQYKLGKRLVFYFDPRAREIFKRHIGIILSHKNQWTGLALKDEPVIGVYELDNELQFMDNMMGIKGKAGYGHADVEDVLPPFFVEELQKQWHSFLRRKYGTDESLRAAWGSMNTGESLSAGTVLLQPTYATAAKYPASRGSDIVAFYRQLFVETSQELVRHIRSFGTAGRGAAVVPIIFHTIASVHGLHIAYSNSAADAVAYGNYWMQYADEERVAKKQPLHYPWYSYVERGPGIGFYSSLQTSRRSLYSSTRLMVTAQTNSALNFPCFMLSVAPGRIWMASSSTCGTTALPATRNNWRVIAFIIRRLITVRTAYHVL